MVCSLRISLASAALWHACRARTPNAMRAWPVSSRAKAESSTTMVTAPLRLTEALSRSVSPSALTAGEEPSRVNGRHT